MGVARIRPEVAHQHLESNPETLLVCAYDSQDKFRANHLEGAISLDEFRAKAGSLPNEREVIFYCA